MNRRRASRYLRAATATAVLALLGGVAACRTPRTAGLDIGPGTTVPDDGAPFSLALPDQGLVLHVGVRETLLEPDKLPGVRFFPDIGTVVLDRNPVRALMAAGNIPLPTQLVTGTDWRHLTSARPVLKPGAKDEFDNGGVAITGVYRHKDGKLFGVYYGEDHEGVTSQGTPYPGFYASNGLAVSSDNGETWTKLGRVITSARSKEWVIENHLPAGGAGTSSAVLSPDGAYWLVYYTEWFRTEYPFLHICVARHRVSDGAPAPGSFLKYYDGAFDQPGIGGLDSPVLSLASDSLNVGSPHVTWVGALNRYVMTVDILNRSENQQRTPLKKDGTGISFSRDGIRWSRPRQLWVDYTVPIQGKSLSWQATLVLDREDALDGWLLYSHSPKWGLPPGSVPHHLVGRRIRFQRVEALQPRR